MRSERASLGFLRCISQSSSHCYVPFADDELRDSVRPVPNGVRQLGGYQRETVALVGATFMLVYVGLVPLIRNKKADLAERLSKISSIHWCRTSCFSQSHNLLIFRNDVTATGMEMTVYFEIRQMDGNIFQQRLTQIVGSQRIIMTFELDDHVLTPLEEVAFYVKHNELDFQDAYRVFGTYFDIVFSNEEIGKYLELLRRRAPNAYREAQALYEKMNEYDVELRPRG